MGWSLARFSIRPAKRGLKLAPMLPLPLPILAGVVWYLSRRLMRRRSAATRKQYMVVGSLMPGTVEFEQAVEIICAAQTAGGNRLTILYNGDEIFPAMLEAIQQAKYTISMVTYVYWRGEIAQQIASALCERSQAGVSCKVLLDAFGADKISRKLLKQMRQSGVEVKWFRPLAWYDLNRLNNRTHRKVLVVDGLVGFTGGVGIAKEWTGHAQDRHHWRDTHIRVEGPAARGLQGAFNDNWFETTGEVLVGEHYLPPPSRENENERGESKGAKVQIVRSTASKYDTNVETLFLLALAAARHQFWLSTAYFVPTPAFVQALSEAAQRGVDVRVLTAGPCTNKKLVRWAGRTSYSTLLAKGVRVYEFEPTMLHAKTLVVDGVWGTVGSTNFDNRSFALNDEINLCFQDPASVSDLEGHFKADLERAKEINWSEWQRLGPVERLLDRLSAMLTPEL